MITFKELTINTDEKLCYINGEAIALSKKEWHMNISLK